MIAFSDIQKIAGRHHVKRLELFGSAARGVSKPNDYDFLVEFQDLPPIEHGNAYFELLANLEDELKSKVDLVELIAVKNPYFLKAIEPDRILVYAA